MLLPMLRAVEKMLQPNPLPQATETGQFMVKVECARTILQEIISTLEPTTTLGGIPIPENPKPSVREKPGDKPTLEPQHPQKEPPPEVEVTGEKEWFITVDDNKGLLIKDMPFDYMLEVDGKKVKYGEARGRTFKKVRIL